MSRTAISLAAVQVVPRLSRPSSKVIAAEAGPMARALDQAALAAAGDAKVLLTGETGVGKDLVAREIHAGSARAPHPFIAVNCAGFTEALLQSELFGHAKGSFTGAFRDNPGRLRLANHGTLFLDEVGGHEPPDAGFAAALPGHRRAAAGGRHGTERHGGCSHRQRHESRLGRPGCVRNIPRRSAVPASCVPHSSPTSARTKGRHPWPRLSRGEQDPSLRGVSEEALRALEKWCLRHLLLVM